VNATVPAAKIPVEEVLDVEARRGPLFFKMVGLSFGGAPVDHTLTPLGVSGDDTYGQVASWAASYLDGLDPVLVNEFHLHDFAVGVRENVSMDLVVPVLGNLAEKYGAQGVKFTVVDLGGNMSDWWEPLSPNARVPCVGSVWINQKIGLPQFSFRVRADKGSKGSHPYLRLAAVRYVEASGVYFPQRIDYILDGWQRGLRTVRTKIEINGVKVAD
jgi:hypothetical protein